MRFRLRGDEQEDETFERAGEVFRDPGTEKLLIVAVNSSRNFGSTCAPARGILLFLPITGFLIALET